MAFRFTSEIASVVKMEVLHASAAELPVISGVHHCMHAAYGKTAVRGRQPVMVSAIHMLCALSQPISG